MLKWPTAKLVEVQKAYDAKMDAMLLDQPYDLDGELDKVCPHAYIVMPDGLVSCGFCGRVHP